MLKKVTVALSAVLLTSNVHAGGLIADILKPVIGEKNADSLDDAHDRLKNAIPPYKAVEEGVSGAVRHVTREAVVESNGPVLARLIQASRDDARRAGTNSIPRHIRSQLVGYFDARFLDSIRYRVGQGHELSLQANSFRFGDAAAIALGDTIIFRDGYDSQNNSILWAHELAHIDQYRRWGLLNFAKRYIRNYGAVEAEADNVAGRYAVWAEQQRYARSPNTYFNSLNPQNISTPVGNICRTHMGGCQLPQLAPIGMSCYCGTYYGPVYGSVAP